MKCVRCHAKTDNLVYCDKCFEARRKKMPHVADTLDAINQMILWMRSGRKPRRKILQDGDV